MPMVADAVGRGLLLLQPALAMCGVGAGFLPALQLTIAVRLLTSEGSAVLRLLCLPPANTNPGVDGGAGSGRSQQQLLLFTVWLWGAQRQITARLQNMMLSVW